MTGAEAAEAGVTDLKVTGDLTVQLAAEQKVILVAALEALEAPQRLRLDLSGVTEIDSAGLQLLLMLDRQARLTGKELDLVRAGRPLLDVLALAQLQPDLRARTEREQPDRQQPDPQPQEALR
jgi:anti-sigma B factor antagonist